MSPELLALLELLLVLGTVLGLAVWDLVRLRRDMARERHITRPDDTKTGKEPQP